MNKVILTHDRVFMSIVGPSGCGNTELLFRMLKGSPFIQALRKFFIFKKSSNHFSKIGNELYQGLSF